MNPTKQGLKQTSRTPRPDRFPRLSTWIQQNKDWNRCIPAGPLILEKRLSTWIQQNKDWNYTSQSLLSHRGVGLSTWIQQNKDWNNMDLHRRIKHLIVLAHESNKTRIETPLLKGLYGFRFRVLAHESNKTRIETRNKSTKCISWKKS